MNTLNWMTGWWLILAGFLSGALVGLGFQRDEFAGGYGSWRRRLLRLGHVACVALGMLNLLYALGPVARPWPSGLFVLGGVAMPVICFLSAWRPGFRHLFGLPVLALVGAVVLTIRGGLQ